MSIWWNSIYSSVGDHCPWANRCLPAIIIILFISAATPRLSGLVLDPSPNARHIPSALASSLSRSDFDLAAVFTTAYERGRFGRRIPYRGDLPAHVKEEDRAWVESVLKSHDTSGK